MAYYRDIFKVGTNGLLPEQGSLLVAEPFSPDDYFQRSVVLLVEHTKEGAMGFILNKKTDLITNTFFPELEEAPALPIYFGGPVCPDRLFFIHSLGDVLVPGAEHITGNLYFDGDFQALKRYILGGNPVEGYVKFFLGYSGWAEGQLRSEIDQVSWVVSHQPDRDLLLAEDESYWKKAVRMLGNAYRPWAQFPKYPYLN